MILLFVIIMIGLPIAQSQFYSLAQDYQVSSQPIPGTGTHSAPQNISNHRMGSIIYLSPNKLASPLDHTEQPAFWKATPPINKFMLHT